MVYFYTFLEGIITFISPCLLPMLPIYLSYFAGDNRDGDKKNTITNALGFVLGFTMVFVMLGLFAGTAGLMLRQHQTAVNIVTGLIVILFGLNFMGALRIPLLNKTIKMEAKAREVGFLSAMLFGIVFSIGWTPCVGAFLGSALMMASQQGSAVKGMLMLLCFSAGLGIPFIAAAGLIDQLKGAFDWIKRHYRAVNIASGALLVVVGILMMTGHMNAFLSMLTI